MTAFMRVFRYEFLRNIRRKGYLFMTIGVPIIVLGLYFGVTNYRTWNEANAAPKTDEEKLPVNVPFLNQAGGYVDLAGVIPTSANTAFKRYDSEAAAQEAINASEIGFYYLIPTDYVQTGKIQMYFNRLTIETGSRPMRNLMRESLLAEKNVAKNIVARLQNNATIVTHGVTVNNDVKQNTSEDAAFALVYAFAMVLFISAFTTSTYLMQSMVEEKETRVVEILISSVRPRDLLMGKIAALSILGLSQMFLWGATLIFIIRQLAGNAIDPTLQMLGLNISDNQLVVIVIYFLLGYMLFASIFAAVGAVSTSMREGPQIAGFILFPAMIPLWFTFIFASQPNGTIATILSIFPLTAPLSMLMRVAVTEVPAGEVLISMVLLGLTVVFTSWLAGRLFRVNTLLSGQTPKLRDIMRIVRETA